MTISANGSLDMGVQASRTHEGTSANVAGTHRRTERRAVSVALLLIGVFALVSGSWSLFVPRGSLIVLAHVVGGSVFGVLSVVHVRYNRNALRLYLRDLGWPPAVLRLAIAAAISLIVLAPVLRLI